jgi:hypothetical protein
MPSARLIVALPHAPLVLRCALQVTQATLPFGQSAMVYDPVTFTYTAPFKQLMRMRLLLNNAEAAQVCWSRGERQLENSPLRL